MLKPKKSLVIILAALFSFCNLALAAVKRPPVRYTVLFNQDIRHADENFYSNRLEVPLSRELNRKITVKATPLVEARHSLKRHKLERLTTGLELGLNLTDYFYAGEQFRQVWRSEPVYNRGVIKNTNMPEALSIIKISCPLIPDKNIKGYISGEYTYDFRLGRGARVESLAGLTLPAGKSMEVNLDWRHRDRIHADDCDTFEAGLTYNF